MLIRPRDKGKGRHRNLFRVHGKVFAAHVFIRLYVSSFQDGAGGWGRWDRRLAGWRVCPGELVALPGTTIGRVPPYGILDGEGGMEWGTE